MGKQRGLSLIGTIIILGLVAFFGLLAAKMLPAYVEYFGVKKILTAMEKTGETKGSVKEIRRSYETRNAIEDVKSVRPEDLEISKEGGENVVTANWSVKVPLVYNISACIDFTATTARQ